MLTGGQLSALIDEIARLEVKGHGGTAVHEQRWGNLMEWGPWDDDDSARRAIDARKREITARS